LDFTYYESLTKDQIMAVPISGSTAFSRKVVNAGEIKNNGIEVQLDLIPVQTQNFSWDLGVTFTKSNSKVVSLNESSESITLNTLWGVSVEARPGEEFGTIYGKDYLRDNFGRKLITDEGVAQPGERIKLGSMNPDFYGGITNNFNYKNLSLRTLISYQKGGEIFSWGRGYRTAFGTDAMSLPGRETGIIEDGINENTGFVNDVPISSLISNFTNIWANEIRSDLVLDASRVKMQEIVLSYNFPMKYLNKTFIQGLNISAFGRDLFFIYNAAEEIDPEGGYSSGPTGATLEHASLPSTRTIGMNLKVNF